MSTDKQLFIQKKIEENLYEFFAKDIKTARDSEIYIAIAKTLRLMIGKIWHESMVNARQDKTLYILSFEYSLGTRLVSNAIKLGLIDDLVEVLKQNNRDFDKICDQEIESQLGFGELGTISTAMLESLSNLEENAHAYGLRYRKGMLKQEIVDGLQIEKPDDWKDYKNPWEHEKSFSHLVNLKDNTYKAIPYDFPIVGDRNKTAITLRIWKSESTKDINFKLFSQGKILESYEDINRANSIVEFLYPQEDTLEGRKLRLSQEYFFASATMQDILKRFKKYHGNNISEFPDKNVIQLNDNHPILSLLVFINLVHERFGFSIDEAINVANKSFIYVNTSLIEENFEKWDLSLIEQVCPSLLPTIYALDKYVKDELRKNIDDVNTVNALSIVSNDYVETINIAFFLSRKIMVLGDQHDRVLKEIYLPYHYHYYGDKIDNLSLGFNGLNYLEQTNKQMYNVLTKDDIVSIRPIEELCSPEDCLMTKLKQNKKDRLIKYLNGKGDIINPKSIFDMNLGVFHEYKRQLLSAMSIALLYFRLKQNGNLDITPRTYFFGGKSYPNYYFAKEIIKFIHALAKLINEDFSIKDKIKIVFVEDYNIKKSDMLIPAADINQHVSVITMGSVDLATFKFMVNGSVTFTSHNTLANDYVKEMEDDSIYIFGDDIDKGIQLAKTKSYSMYDYINRNHIIKDMFDFYRYQPYSKFPYNINTIIDVLFKYNDGYGVIRELLPHFEKHLIATKDYMNQEEWVRKSLSNISYALNHTMNESIKTNFNNYWR